MFSKYSIHAPIGSEAYTVYLQDVMTAEHYDRMLPEETARAPDTCSEGKLVTEWVDRGWRELELAIKAQAVEDYLDHWPYFSEKIGNEIRELEGGDVLMECLDWALYLIERKSIVQQQNAISRMKRELRKIIAGPERRNVKGGSGQ